MIKTKVDRMISLGVVEPSDLPWTSLVILVWKMEDSFHFCQLNKVTDSYPLPNIEHIINALAGPKYFSLLDLALIWVSAGRIGG